MKIKQIYKFKPTFPSVMITIIEKTWPFLIWFSPGTGQLPLSAMEFKKNSAIDLFRKKLRISKEEGHVL